jgi:hypothetical protein
VAQATANLDEIMQRLAVSDPARRATIVLPHSPRPSHACDVPERHALFGDPVIRGSRAEPFSIRQPVETGGWPGRTLIATVRSSRVSRARYTLPTRH